MCRIIVFISFLCLLHPVNAQKFYTAGSGEFLFAFSEVEKNMDKISSNMRFSLFFQYGDYLHWDFHKVFGLSSGYSIRNIGMNTTENNIKIKRRAYSLSVPLGIKIGDMKNHFYLLGGAEYEYLFHFKEKQFLDDGKKKYSEWFSNRVNRFIPSVFAGIQFPDGFCLKVRYYMDHFLNHGFYKENSSFANDYRDFTRTQLFMLSITWQPRETKIKDILKDKPSYDI